MDGQFSANRVGTGRGGPTDGRSPANLVATRRGRRQNGTPRPADVAGDPDVVIRGLAARQHGVVARTQLREAGVPAHRIEYRVRKGRLQPIHRGVYRVGPIGGAREREMAAVLALGGDAVVSHGSAGAMWGLLSPVPPAGLVDVTVERDTRGPRGVRVHRTALRPREVTRLGGVPVTTPARTLLDLAGVVGGRALERAWARAEREGWVSMEEMEALLSEHPRRPGSRALRALVAGGGAAFTRSVAEERFRDLLADSGLPAARSNTRVHGIEVDLFWPEERLVVELDGFEFHRSRGAFERDRARDAALEAAGIRVLRYTWRHLDEQPKKVLVQVTQALVRSGRG